MTNYHDDNKHRFLFEDFPGEFIITFDVHGTVDKTITADSLDHAKKMAEDMADDESSTELLELDEADSIEINSVRPRPTMYLANRSGAVIQTSRVWPEDEPRGRTSYEEERYMRRNSTDLKDRRNDI